MKTFFFDVDKTTVNGVFFTDYYHDKFGIYIDPKFFRTDDWNKVITGQITDNEVVEKNFEEWQVAKTYGTVEKLLEAWYSIEDNTDPQMIGLVDELKKKGYKCYAATSQSLGRANYIWEDMGFKDHFDGIAVSCRLGVAKPNHEFYVRAVELAGTSPEESILIDDKESFIEGALNAGWDAIHFIGIDNLKSELKSRGIETS